MSDEPSCGVRETLAIHQWSGNPRKIREALGGQRDIFNVLLDSDHLEEGIG